MMEKEEPCTFSSDSSLVGFASSFGVAQRLHFHDLNSAAFCFSQSLKRMMNSRVMMHSVVSHVARHLVRDRRLDRSTERREIRLAA